jgi:hypothetical protein
MATIGIGPAGRELVKIEIGGNGQQPGNTQGNNAPVVTGPPVHANNGENPGQNGKAQNGGGVEQGGNPKAAGGNQNQPVGGLRPENNDQGNGLALGRRAREIATVKPGRIGQIEPLDIDWPILTQLNDDSLFDTDKADETRRSDDARDRQYQESFGANQANVRRGLIRDYLRQNLQDTILETRTGTNSPLDLQRLTQTVADRISRTYNDPAILNGRNLNLITQEISHLLVREFQPNTGNPIVIPHDRACQIASLLLAQIAGESPTGFAHLTDQQMLDALVFLQLCCLPGGHIKDMREIMTHKPTILPDGIPWSMLRDAGLLAANLMREGVSFRTAAYLDLAVQRFVKMLIANNELGVLLAAVRLTADARAARLPSGSVASLVRIYELIAQLMILTERAMKEAADAAARKPVEVKRAEKSLAFAGALEPAETESALRQYLAFNPSAQADSGASAFFSVQVAETSARIAVDSSQREITEWLESGRHRFVTEVDLGKPVGIVIDRGSDECFTASQIRIVLVRDASVLGWHILRSCLVG